MLFTDFPLEDRLQRALVTVGFVTPTPIQAAVLPVAITGRDLLGTAQTGTGKTAAYVLPILQRLLNTPVATRRTRVVILAPTRELVEQILAVVRELALHTNLRGVAVYGGVAMQPQTRALKHGVEIIVACPGRLLDHIQRGNADFRHLDCLVLDEADRMLDMGFMPAIDEIIDAMRGKKRQTMLFSATFPKALNAFIKDTLNDPARLMVDNAVPAKTVRHSLYQVKESMKAPMLTSLLRQLMPESDAVLIFTQTRVTANQVAEHLSAAGMDADVLHAEKTQRERRDTLDRFRAGAFPYLVATDIAARGIDVASISHVINFDFPSKPDDYLHRIGRTGRMERAGHAISLMTRGDVRAVREIERMLGTKIVVAQLETSDNQQLTDVIPGPTVGGVRPAKPRNARARHAETTSAGMERPAQRHNADAPSARPRKPFGRTSPTGRPPYFDGDRQHRGNDAAPPRRTSSYTAEDRAAPGTAAPARPEFPGNRQFTGMAAVSKHRRQHAAGKRQSGEVSAGPRPTPRYEPGANFAKHKKRLGRRGK